jgi:hypothetical protein
MLKAGPPTTELTRQRRPAYAFEFNTEFVKNWRWQYVPEIAGPFATAAAA